jgi:hypothetical protein
VLRLGSLLLIKRGEIHEIRNAGRRPMRTLNVSVPPAYTWGGEPLPPGPAVTILRLGIATSAGPHPNPSHFAMAGRRTQGLWHDTCGELHSRQ